MGGSLTSLLFRDGVLRDDDDPLRLGGRSILIPFSDTLPFSLTSPGVPAFNATWSPFTCGEVGS